MADVIPFARPEKPEPHLSGQAVCIGCRHEWTAVAPVGTAQLDCPSCSLPKGLWKHPVSADDGDALFRCNCGCEALVAYYRKAQFRIVCMACGTHQTEALFG